MSKMIEPGLPKLEIPGRTFSKPKWYLQIQMEQHWEWSQVLPETQLFSYSHLEMSTVGSLYNQTNQLQIQEDGIHSKA